KRVGGIVKWLGMSLVSMGGVLSILGKMGRSIGGMFSGMCRLIELLIRDNGVGKVCGGWEGIWNGVSGSGGGMGNGYRLGI
ncbi:hypothetical protein, partial [Staphylococcus epidermidis]|uniref:hypothetical protein n=1 Tax=Staphylococcus epidermidis TaxID=1282 RepID=UPI001C930563